MTGETPARMMDFNVILRWINAIIGVATVAAYLKVGGNAYVDGETIVLAAMVVIQTHVALLVERWRRDPFVIVLAFILILYYSLRILTLVLFPFSFVLDRFPYVSSDSNHALVVMLVANTLMYAGFYVVRGGTRLHVEIGSWRPTAPSRALVLVVGTIVFVYAKAWLGLDVLPRLIQTLLVFVTQSLALLLALTYYLLFRKTLSRTYAAVLIGLLVLEMVLHSLSGSRSAFIYSVQNVLIVILAVRGSVALSRRLVVAGLAILPVAVVFLVASFTISTYVRATTMSDESFSITAALERSREAGARLNRQYALEAGLPVMLSRAGFFDYSAEIIAHDRQYAPIINVPAYARSVVDNILSPGFDVFDQPRISNSLRFVYAERGKPSRVASAEAYQSDQLGIYGELYVLFGYASLPIFFAGAFLIKRVYMSARDANPFVLAIKRVVTLTIFVSIMNSFGLDWALMDLVPLVVSIYLYRYFFKAAPVQEALLPAV